MSEKRIEFKVAKTLDCKGDLCPMPVYKASRTMAQLNAGDVLEIICTDKGSIKDFPAFCTQTGHELLETTSAHDVHTFYIRKGGAQG